ncbi:hypothetical protein [Lysobacter gummosus]
MKAGTARLRSKPSSPRRRDSTDVRARSPRPTASQPGKLRPCRYCC